jgi:protein-L-isoaspartate(D-aspartate) O-methyltransferase
MRNRFADWLHAAGYVFLLALAILAAAVLVPWLVRARLPQAVAEEGQGTSAPAAAQAGGEPVKAAPADTEVAKAASPAGTVPSGAAPQGAVPPVAASEGAAKEKPSPEPLVWDRPRFEERRAERLRMVQEQMARRDVKDEAVLDAMRQVPRHLFVPDEGQREAYADHPLPIGYGQTISQPYIVAYMTELLGLKPGARVLEIGTGSGYQAAVLSELTPHVYSIEIIRQLAEQAGQRLRKLGYATVQTKQDDGYYGWKEHAPFDAIIVTAAAGHVPPPLVEQLKPGGKMVVPVGGVYETQYLVVVTKEEDGRVRTRSVLPVRFVPMTGQAQREP